MRSHASKAIALGFMACLTACAPPSFVVPPSGPPALAIVQATDLGTIPVDSDILGRDGGYSALFDDNSVWLYGDTFLAHPNAADFTLISDSWSFTSDLNAQNGITGFEQTTDAAGAPTMILPETPAEQSFNQAHNVNNCTAQPCGARWALWHMSIVVDPASNQALIFYQVVSAQPGNFNFASIGSSVATWQSLNAVPVRPTLGTPVVAGHPDVMFSASRPSFGTASVITAGMLYAYGCGVPTESLDWGCRLGRVAPAQAQSPGAWTFYAGNGIWTSQIANAVSVFVGDSIVSVSWNSYLGQYIAVYSAPFSQNVIIRTAPNPEGPWSDEIVAFVAQAPVSGNVYDAVAHSEFDVNGGQTIFVSYSRSTGAFTSEARLEAVELKSTP